MANVNSIQLSGAAASSAPSVAAVGSDTNIDLTLTPKGTGDVYSGSDLDAAGGYRQTGPTFYQDNVAASQSGVALVQRGTAPSFGEEWVAPRAGSITGVVVKSNAARSAGTLTVEVRKNGTGVGLTAVLDGTNTTVKASTQAKDTDAFAAGDELDIAITTDGSWAPTTADIVAVFEVET